MANTHLSNYSKEQFHDIAQKKEYPREFSQTFVSDTPFARHECRTTAFAGIANIGNACVKKIIIFVTQMKKEKNMKMSIKTALAVLFALFAANIVAEAQIDFPPPAIFQGTSGYVEEVLDNERMAPYIEDYIVTPPNCFTEDPNCQYGPWHPVGFQYHATNPTTSDGSYSGNEIDDHCVVLAKLWIRERKNSSEIVIEVNFVEFDLYYLNQNGTHGTKSNCDICAQRFLQDMSSIRLNIRRAVDLLTLSGRSFISYPWNIGDTYSYEIATPGCVGYNSSNDLRLTYYFYQTVDNNNNTITAKYNDMSNGMITSNIQSCWLKCCKHRIKVRKQLNKSRSSFTLQDDIAISSDTRPCQEQCLNMACGPVADSEAPMYVGNGTPENPMTIDFYEPPHYRDIISLVTGGVIYNAGALIREVPPRSQLLGILPTTQTINTSINNTIFSTVYPNPCNSNVSFAFASTNNGNYKLEIYNELNELIFSSTFEKKAFECVEELSVDSFLPGVYYYTIKPQDEIKDRAFNGKFTVVK